MSRSFDLIEDLPVDTLAPMNVTEQGGTEPPKPESESESTSSTPSSSSSWVLSRLFRNMTTPLSCKRKAILNLYQGQLKRRQKLP